jgi:hypothetical protein
MSQKHIRWLEGEIPKLVTKGVLSTEVASRLGEHYRSTGSDESSRRNLVMLFFSILGALLVGGGVVLLLAHNWDALSRPVRVAISLAPLLATQLLGAWVVLHRRASVAWREAVGIGLTFAVTLALALVSQTYNIPTNLGTFLLQCVLLVIPVVYILNAATPAVLILAAITTWTADAGSGGMSVLGFWALIALVLPYFWMMKRTARHPAWHGLLGWSLAIALTVGSAITMHDIVPHGLIPVFGALFAGFVALGGTDPWRREPWSRALRTVGTLGVVGLSLVLTYPELWEDLRPKAWPTVQTADEILALSTTAAFVLWAPALLVLFHRRMGRKTVAVAGASVVSLITWSLIWLGSPDIVSPVAFNLYLFVLGLIFLMEGVSLRSLGTANGGMAILTLLMAVRFFDPSISFVIRGLLFIGVGAGFLMTNLYLVRNRKRAVA